MSLELEGRQVSAMSSYTWCRNGNRKIDVKMGDIFGKDRMTIVEVTV
ncbi:MAG: hypothetical protein GDA43_05200 [Hormoscilla sp. SP5CHS1]|nr:hypothetical protein [Hormoscilla sp. SP12CHS1]MBC6452662.1 hypothetical protein [Hormoscilla sp. SP5CHS1]MBC6480649.1 hypothetical protein [Hormoscilla sp. GM7CHS1pb]MBO1351976.1 hypothetical protein [Hormoscilla sp. GUM202]